MLHELYLLWAAEQAPALSGANGILFLGIAILAGVLLSGVYVFSIVWAAIDAANRGKPWFLVTLLVALVAWPIGLVLWLAFRPKPAGGDRSLGSERKP